MKGKGGIQVDSKVFSLSNCKTRFLSTELGKPVGGADWNKSSSCGHVEFKKSIRCPRGDDKRFAEESGLKINMWESLA